MAIIVNVDLLRNYEKPVTNLHGQVIDVLQAIKKVQEASGEGLGIDEAIERNGVALEKAFNESVVPGIQATLNTLAASADNAEAVLRLAGQMEAVSTAAVDNVQVKQGVHPAFGRG
jgi:hypothetical protein